MAKHTKSPEQKAKEQLAKLLGMDMPVPQDEEAIQTDREEEAALAYTAGPTLFERKKCNKCGRKFAVNRRNVAYCSRLCRRRSLMELGIPAYAIDENGPRGDEDSAWVKRAWDGNEPLIVPEHLLEQIDEILDRQKATEINIPEPTNSSIDVVIDVDSKITGDSSLTSLLSLDLDSL